MMPDLGTATVLGTETVLGEITLNLQHSLVASRGRGGSKVRIERWHAEEVIAAALRHVETGNAEHAV